MAKMDISFNQTLVAIPSTHLIENIKLNALELSKQMGKGFTIRIDVLSNDTTQSCNVFLEKLRID
jgi:hypothetical protein